MHSIDRFRILIQVLDTVVSEVLCSNMGLKHSTSFARPRKISRPRLVSRTIVTRLPFRLCPADVPEISPTIGACSASARSARHHGYNSPQVHKSMKKTPAQASCFQYLAHSFRAFRISLNLKGICQFLTLVFSVDCAYFSWKSIFFKHIRIAYPECTPWLHNATLAAASGTGGTMRFQRRDKRSAHTKMEMPRKNLRGIPRILAPARERKRAGAMVLR
jgi:hypothetical protein